MMVELTVTVKTIYHICQNGIATDKAETTYTSNAFVIFPEKSPIGGAPPEKRIGPTCHGKGVVTGSGMMSGRCAAPCL